MKIEDLGCRYPPSFLKWREFLFFLTPDTWSLIFQTTCCMNKPDKSRSTYLNLGNIIVNYSHQYNTGNPKPLTQQQKLCTHFRRKNTDIARQLMAQSPHGKSQDISDQQGQDGLFNGQNPRFEQGTGCGKAGCKFGRKT